jgi:hypothetical protein
MNVEVERARYEPEEHRLLCISTVRLSALSPKRAVSTDLKQLAAWFRECSLLSPFPVSHW